MVFHFVILSDEVDDFRREISIDAEATFAELQDLILKTCDYKKDQITSFFICEADWSKQTEITMIAMDDDPMVDNWTMDKTHLDDLLEEEKTKLLFMFDPMCERYLFMQLKTIEPSKHLKESKITLKEGKAPVQTKNIDDIIPSKVSADSTFDENMYGDESYDPDELDPDGFSDLEDLDTNLY